MRHLLPLALGLSLAASLAACSNNSTPSSDPAASQKQPVADAKPADKPADRPGDGHGRRGDGHGKRGGFGRDPKKMVEQFDKNASGKIELDELPERMRTRLAEADANKDGAITVEELQASNEKRQKEQFDRDDKNKDGALTADELGEKRWEFIKVADANNDAKITLPEMNEARAAGKLRRMKGDGPAAEKDDDGED